MTSTWQEQAEALIEHAPPTWCGLWTLLYAAGQATHTLALAAPVVRGVDLTVAAMDLHQAREGLEEARPSVAESAQALALGLLPDGEDGDFAHAVVDELVVDALDRIARLAPTGDLTTPEGAALIVATRALRSARSVLSRR